MPWILFLITLLLLPGLAGATDITGQVVGVADGDTLTLLTADKTQVKVRLGEIDTPESKQPFGTRAKQMLSDLAFGKEARMVVQDTDRYGRTVGRVYVGSLDVNAELVKQGGAWVYRQYLKDQSLLTLEAEAKAAKRGLWGLPEIERCPPWDWRRGKCATSSTATKTAPVSSGLTCGSKKTCKQMVSCEEARFYLTQCGLTRLDGDGDGVPCEALCR